MSGVTPWTIPELEAKFEAAQQALISDLYTDVVNHACTDAHVNYHNHLRDELRAGFIDEITSKYGHYSWAHSMRIELLKNHAGEISNKIIGDLRDEVASLNEHIEQLRSFR